MSNPTKQNQSKIGRSEWALLIPFFLILCVGLQFFSNFHKYQNSDSLMFSIMSYTKVTLFYWGQDRMLSMMSFLTSFIKDPSLNLFALATLMLFMTLSLPFLVGKLFDVKHVVLFGFLAIAAMLPMKAFFWSELCFVPYVHSFYPLVLSALACKAALGDENEYRAGWLMALGAFLCLVSYEVAQPGMAIFLCWILYFFWRSLRPKVADGKLILSRDMMLRSCKRLGKFVAVAAVLFFTFSQIQEIALHLAHIDYTFLLADTNTTVIMRGMKTFIVNISRDYVQSGAGMIVLFVLLAVAAAALYKKGLRAQIVKAMGIFMVPALIVFISMSSLEFVRHGNYNQRYASDSIILCVLFFAFLTTRFIEVLNLSGKTMARIPRALAIVSAVVLFISFHPRTFATPKERIQETIPYAAEILSHKEANGIVGDYWKVWPVVWLENADGNRNFYGVTQRFGVVSKDILDRYYRVGHASLLAYPGDSWITPDLAVYYSDPRTNCRLDGHMEIIDVAPSQLMIIR